MALANWPVNGEIEGVVFTESIDASMGVYLFEDYTIGQVWMAALCKTINELQEIAGKTLTKWAVYDGFQSFPTDEVGEQPLLYWRSFTGIWPHVNGSSALPDADYNFVQANFALMKDAIEDLVSEDDIEYIGVGFVSEESGETLWTKETLYADIDGSTDWPVGVNFQDSTPWVFAKECIDRLCWAKWQQPFFAISGVWGGKYGVPSLKQSGTGTHGSFSSAWSDMLSDTPGSGPDTMYLGDPYILGIEPNALGDPSGPSHAICANLLSSSSGANFTDVVGDKTSAGVMLFHGYALEYRAAGVTVTTEVNSVTLSFNLMPATLPSSPYITKHDKDCYTVGATAGVSKLNYSPGGSCPYADSASGKNLAVLLWGNLWTDLRSALTYG